jgi:branched-chain amino acid transport system ATP-binding protein
MSQTAPNASVARATDRSPLRADQHAHALELSGLQKAFGGVRALDGVDLVVPQGSIFGLIGPNGAGKTTLFNAVTGLIQLDSGSILADGVDVTGLRLDLIARSGIARTFQTPRGFSSMTVLENLMLAEHSSAETVVGGLVQGREERGESFERATSLLSRLGMMHLADSPYGELSGGELRLLEISRLMMHKVKLLLLDEPTAGVMPTMQERLADVVRDLVSSGVTAVVVEHNLGFVLRLADAVAVMVNGRVISQGTPRQIQEDPEVISAYLGDVQDLPE